MFTSRDLKTLLLFAASLLLFHPHASAQSGRKAPARQPAHTPAPIDYTRYEKMIVVVESGLEAFVKTLNEQGRLGYRLEKTTSYGGPEEPRKYAGILSLDPGHTYEYASGTVPDEARSGDPLNSYPRLGYTFVHAYTMTYCAKTDVYDSSSSYPTDSTSQTRQETHEVKRNALLFMRRDDAAQMKEYKVFKGHFRMEGGQKKELQDALNAAPPGFRPVSLLFSAGPYTFNVFVLAERNLNEAAPPKVEYEVVKEVFGYENKVNRLAAAGARYVTGGRIDFIKLAVLARQAGAAARYTFKDDHQHEKEFPKMLAARHSYVGLLPGDTSCSSEIPLGQKLVFARDKGGAAPAEYKLLEISDRGPDRKRLTGLLPNASVSELGRLFAEGFRVRDLFYIDKFYAILEKQPDRHAPRQMSQR